MVGVLIWAQLFKWEMIVAPLNQRHVILIQGTRKGHDLWTVNLFFLLHRNRHLHSPKEKVWDYHLLQSSVVLISLWTLKRASPVLCLADPTDPSAGTLDAGGTRAGGSRPGGGRQSTGSWQHAHEWRMANPLLTWKKHHVKDNFYCSQLTWKHVYWNRMVFQSSWLFAIFILCNWHAVSSWTGRLEGRHQHCDKVRQSWLCVHIQKHQCMKNLYMQSQENHLFISRMNCKHIAWQNAFYTSNNKIQQQWDPPSPISTFFLKKKIIHQLYSRCILSEYYCSYICV